MPPDLLEINHDAWQIWLSVQTQTRTSGAGVVGIDYEEVRQAAKRHEIELSTRNWKKIQALEGTMLDNVNPKSN
ncbi:MAG: DUF1799 domain-containing protein [Desulfobacterales bacterium]|nr:DUF1799 domain-containing protein [Desulfobacterales bacterium]